MPFLCGVQVDGQVAVSLPQFPGAVTPPSAESAGAVASYASATDSMCVSSVSELETVSLTAMSPSPASSKTLRFSAVFSTAVTGLTATDVVVSAGSVGSSVTVSGSGDNYTIVVVMTTAISTSVRVRLPAGSVVPANDDSGYSPIVVYSPPVPTMTLLSGESGLVDDNTVVFEVEFSESVMGLVATDFLVEPLHLSSRVALEQVAPLRYLFAVSIEWTAPLCPAGYFLSSTGDLCGRVVDATSWTEASELCFPYPLASMHSANELLFFASLVNSPYAWCDQCQLHCRRFRSPHVRAWCRVGVQRTGSSPWNFEFSDGTAPDFAAWNTSVFSPHQTCGAIEIAGSYVRNADSAFCDTWLVFQVIALLGCT